MTDTIDPGPGYRILDPIELLLEGDEFYTGADIWRPCENWKSTQGRKSSSYFYRRKIPSSIMEIAKALQHDAKSPLRACDIPSTISPTPEIDPSWIPKPFTPNKYTRYIPTLDGRLVPVDVYCVSEAFDLGICGIKSTGALDAVHHSRKKLLAPGQRGQKTALQDIKEAYASLGRAIALEEAAIGREVQNG